jgi:hypothetical protein
VIARQRFAIFRHKYVGVYSQQIGFKSQDVIAASVLAVRGIRENEHATGRACN